MVTLQYATNGGLRIFGVSALPAVAMIVAIGMNYGPFVGGVYGLFSGLLMDVYTIPSVGFHLVMMPFLGIACGLAANHLLMNNRYARFFLCLCSAIVYCFFYFVVIQWIAGGNSFAYYVDFSLPMTGACAVTAGVLCFLVKLYQTKL